MADDLPPYSAHISHRVEDADRWKVRFDDLEDARRSAGILGHHILRAVDEPSVITLFLALTDLDQARAFTSSYGRDEVMHHLGVLSDPSIEWLRPVHGTVVPSRQLPAVLLRRRVSDVDAWLAGYDAAVDRRNAGGIIGQTVECSLDAHPSIVVSLQAERAGTLHDYVADPEVRAMLTAHGSDAELTVSFHTGGWTKTYRSRTNGSELMAGR